MTFYDGTTIHVSPCEVLIGRTSLYYTNDGAYPIIVCNGKAMIGEEGTEHCDFDGSTTTGRNIEARFWVKPRILTVWNSYAPSEYMRAIGEKITEKFGVPLDKIRFIWDSFVESEDYRTIACEMPLSEYISMNPKTDLNSLLSYLYNRKKKLEQNKLSRQAVSSNGMASSDMWRHYQMVGENKTNKNMKKKVIKLNESALRRIVAESVKKVIKEYVEGEQGGTDVYKCVPDTYVDYYLKANKYGDYSVLAGNQRNSIYPGKIVAVPTPEEAQLLSKKYGQCILKITASTEGVSQGRNCVLVEPDSVLNIERIA